MQKVKVLSAYKYRLTSRLAVDVPADFPSIKTPRSFTREKLTGGRELVLDINFPWDGASGAIDTDGVLIPSAFHDEICELTKQGTISWKPWRKWGDKLYFRLCKLNSVNWFRARAHFWAVRGWSRMPFSKRDSNLYRTVPCEGVTIYDLTGLDEKV